MARYSSDSDSERSKYRKKHSRRSRSSSVESIGSSSSHQKRSSKYSRARRRYRSRSRSRDKSSRSYGKYSRGSSRDRDRRRYRRSRSASPDRKSRRRSQSKEKSSTNSSQSNTKTTEKPSQFTKDVVAGEPTIRASVLEEIQNDEFVPKTFTSSRSTKTEPKMKNIVIDMAAETIRVPESPVPIDPDSIFHTIITTDRDVRFDRWVKKFYSLRQKAMSEVN